MSRRAVLTLAAGTSACAATHAVAQKALAGSRTNDLVTMDATTLASVIHSRKASCVEVMTAYLDHIERVNPKVNAIVALQERGDLLARHMNVTASSRVANRWGRCTAFHTP
jgi:amidase